MLKELIREKITPLFMLAGDKLQVTWKWDDPRMGENILAEIDIDKEMKVDTIIVCEFQNMHGLKEGYQIVIGN